jgi:hypothetical protein
MEKKNWDGIQINRKEQASNNMHDLANLPYVEPQLQRQSDSLACALFLHYTVYLIRI